MAHKDLRDWINKLEAEGELKRIHAEVDWNVELGAIARVNLARIPDAEKYSRGAWAHGTGWR